MSHKFGGKKKPEFDRSTMSGRFEEMRWDKEICDEAFIASGYGAHDDILDFVEAEIKLAGRQKEIKALFLGLFYGAVLVGAFWLRFG